MSRTTNLSSKPAFGKLVLNKLNVMNKTQKWLAEETGVTATHIYCIVTGRTVPSLQLLISISKVIGIETKILVETLCNSK